MPRCDSFHGFYIDKGGQLLKLYLLPVTDARSDIANEVSGTVYGDVTQVGEQHNYLSGPRIPTPRQLPSPPGQFVNRSEEFELLDRLATPTAAQGTPVVVVTGMHGVGKTATGRCWASSNSERFEDGQLYASFRESPGDDAEVYDILGGFLRAFGLPDEMIPADLAERTALFRSSTAGKRILVLLDDVDHADQVEPLIPNARDGLVLVTTRAPLEELVQDGADLVRLDPLDPDCAKAILRQMIGKQRVEDEPEAVEQLAEICAGLPVVLRICGARLASRERRTVASLVAELADEARRLDRIFVGRDRSIEAVFTDAYGALSPAAAELYRRLGIHPGPLFTAPLAAAAADLEPSAVENPLDELCVAHLIESGDDRLCFHDLLRIHARRTGERVDSDSERSETLRRIVDFYVAAAQRMDRALAPERLRLADDYPPPGPPSADPPEPRFGSPEDAFAWFETERPNLLAVIRAAADRGWDKQVWYLGEALWLPYHNQKHFGEAIEVHGLAATCAQRLGDVGAEGRVRIQLARAHMDVEDYARAERELELAGELAERSGNRALQASVVEFSGVLQIALERYPEAIAALERSRRVYEELGNDRGVALQEYHLGRALALGGDHARAVVSFSRAGKLIDPAADGLIFARILLHEGESLGELGESEAAAASLERALGATVEHAIPFYEATVREHLGAIAAEQGDQAVARGHWDRALAIYTSLGSKRAERVSARLARSC
jgi:tetratricopeptide (TPR) repeat protein